VSTWPGSGSEALVKYGNHPPVSTGASCEGCGARPRRPVTDHCHRHGWVRGILCGQCNANMTLVDRGILPRVQQAAALVAFARRCPGCPAVDMADLASLAGRAGCGPSSP
jgi:hypothetical protein